jgi:predicted ATP-grasp superfamily ATP-dependent carboligase
MLGALLEDFARVEGVEAFTLMSPAGARGLFGRWPKWVHAGAEQPLFGDLARRADFTLVIAPEFDHLLETRCRWVVEVGGRLLNPSVEAVRLAADKWALARHWQSCGIPTPPCRRAGEAGSLPFKGPLVLKPRHGAGSQATFLVQTEGELAGALARAGAELGREEFLLQPFVPGLAASVAFLIGPRQHIALAPASQDLSADGRFHYQGGRLPFPPPLAERALNLTRRAVASVPGLVGYVGIDMVLGGEADGSRDQAIELNPRLTTSYVGLRALAQNNLMEVLLRVVRGEDLPALGWRRGEVRFTADGNFTWNELPDSPVSRTMAPTPWSPPNP